VGPTKDQHQLDDEEGGHAHDKAGEVETNLQALGTEGLLLVLLQGPAAAAAAGRGWKGREESWL
jgi:hypothetical protein